jgi:hypothetical protein
MHSSKLRGIDFRLLWRDEEVDHTEFFSSFRDTDRLGVVIANRTEGIGAITLIMSYVTAFFDRYRERGAEFFAYPDFFTFQRQTPCANYGMCDIWPYHKNVFVGQDGQETVEAITDRGVNILLVPDNAVREVEIAEAEQESARRSVSRCFAYSATGATASPDLVVESQGSLLREFGLAVLDSVSADDAVTEQREQWLEPTDSANLSQSFRELELSEALKRI